MRKDGPFCPSEWVSNVFEILKLSQNIEDSFESTAKTNGNDRMVSALHQKGKRPSIVVSQRHFNS
jgi:hypothetical protein